MRSNLNGLLQNCCLVLRRSDQDPTSTEQHREHYHLLTSNTHHFDQPLLRHNRILRTGSPAWSIDESWCLKGGSCLVELENNSALPTRHSLSTPKLVEFFTNSIKLTDRLSTTSGQSKPTSNSFICFPVSAFIDQQVRVSDYSLQTPK